MDNPISITYQQSEHPPDEAAGLPRDISAALFVEYESGEDAFFFADVPCKDKFACVASPREAIELALAVQRKTREMFASINRPEAIRHARNVNLLEELLLTEARFAFSEIHVVWACEHKDWSDAGGKDARVRLDDAVV